MALALSVKRLFIMDKILLTNSLTFTDFCPQQQQQQQFMICKTIISVKMRRKIEIVIQKIVGS